MLRLAVSQWRFMVREQLRRVATGVARGQNPSMGRSSISVVSVEAVVVPAVAGMAAPVSVAVVRANPAFKRSPNGRPGQACWLAYARPGLPSAPA